MPSAMAARAARAARGRGGHKGGAQVFRRARVGPGPNGRARRKALARLSPCVGVARAFALVGSVAWAHEVVHRRPPQAFGGHPGAKIQAVAQEAGEPASEAGFAAVRPVHAGEQGAPPRAGRARQLRARRDLQHTRSSRSRLRAAEGSDIARPPWRSGGGVQHPPPR